MAIVNLQEKIKLAQKSGYSEQQIRNYLASQGVKPEEIPQFGAAQTPQQPGFLSRVSTDIQNRGAMVADTFATPSPTYSGAVAQGARGAAQVAGGISDVAGEAVASIPYVNTAAKWLGGVAQKATNAVVGKIAETPLFRGAAQNPGATQGLENALSTVSSVGEVVNNVLLAQGVATGAQKTVDTTARLANNTAENIMGAGDSALKFGKDLRANAQAYMGAESNPQLQTAASRLGDTKTISVKPSGKVVKTAPTKPLDLYNADLPVAKKALIDIKADPPIASVGEQTGDAFRRVIAQRKAVGRAMGDELKKIATIKTNIAPAAEGFVKSLDESGVRYNPATGAVDVVGPTKLISTDIKMLNVFAKELDDLGPNPSIAELDAFMSRLPNELNVYKGANGITGVTNAERIMQNTLAVMREQFSPKVTGNPALSGYYKARSTYANLSDFIEEGQGYLGKLSQSGDFVKDASVLKSAVQSILNNGKKDWLIKLEGLTGFPALDRAVIALQAMKDAGDFRGLSLLQTLSSGGAPVTNGITQQIMNAAYELGKKSVLGTPEEQTRAFLSKISDKPTK